MGQALCRVGPMRWHVTLVPVCGTQTLFHCGKNWSRRRYVSVQACAGGSDLVRIPVSPSVSQLLCLVCCKALFSLRFLWDLKPQELATVLVGTVSDREACGRGWVWTEHPGIPRGTVLCESAVHTVELEGDTIYDFPRNPQILFLQQCA